jgi:hypothetical protein
MKVSFSVMLFTVFAFVMQAQVTVNIQKVDASAVPSAVINAQAGYFSGVTVKYWEKQTGSAKDKSGDRYIANFDQTRARYYSNGTGGTATTYYAAKQLPQAIQDAAAANYAGYALISGERVVVLATSSEVYRIQLRKGAQKLVVYVDANGQEISKSSLPKEVTEA